MAIDQPEYGPGLLEVIEAQQEAFPMLLEGLPLEREVREAYAGLESDILARQLLGDIQRFDEEGVYRTTEYDPYDDAALQGYRVERGEDVGTFGGKTYKHVLIGPDGKIKAGTDQPNYMQSFASFMPTEVQAEMQARIDSPRGRAREVERYGEPGTIAAREGGILGLYGGTTEMRQYDPQTGEVKYGTAGFDPDTQEFQGLIPMQQQLGSHLATLQREADVADIELLGDRFTKSLRGQGDIEEVLEDIEGQVQSNVQAVSPLRRGLLSRAGEYMESGLTDRERRNIEQASRKAGQAAGRVRDIGRIQQEALDVAAEDFTRQLQGTQMAQNLLGQESQLQGALLGQQLSRLGAEQSTSADPGMALLGRPTSQAPAAQGMLGTGAALIGQSGSLVQPETGLSYMSQRAANQATAQAGKEAGRGSMIGGLLGGVGSLIGGLF